MLCSRREYLREIIACNKRTQSTALVKSNNFKSFWGPTDHITESSPHVLKCCNSGTGRLFESERPLTWIVLHSCLKHAYLLTILNIPNHYEMFYFSSSYKLPQKSITGWGTKRVDVDAEIDIRWPKFYRRPIVARWCKHDIVVRVLVCHTLSSMYFWSAYSGDN